MKGDSLPDGDSVVRFVRFKDIDEGKILPSAFTHRPNEVGLSVNWLECFRNLSKEKQVAEVRRLARITPRRSWKLAELSVEDTKAHIVVEGTDLSFVEDPLEPEGEFLADPSHSLIVGIPDPESDRAELIGDMIRQYIRAEYPAILDS